MSPNAQLPVHAGGRGPRIAILISGRGSNMAALAGAIRERLLDASVAFVASDREDAPGLETARQLGLKSLILPYGATKASKEPAERLLADALRAAQVEWLILAGFMRILSPAFVARMPGRIVNIHPSLLPAFPGPDAIRDALDHGVKVTGVTVHRVDAQVDHGPILAQQAVAVEPGDTRDSLAAKLHAVEHRLYRETLAVLFAQERGITDA